MDSTITIQVGRIFTTPKGLWGIKLLDGTGGVVLGPGGVGMTKEVAESVLDAIERRQGERKSQLNKEQCSASNN